MRSSLSSRRTRAFGAVALTGVFVLAGAHAAGAKTVSNSCTAIAVNADGSNGGDLPGPFPLDAGIADFGGPTEVNAGATFTASSPSIPIDVPDVVDAPVVGPTPIIEAENIKLTIEIDGAAGIGTPSLSGGDVINPTAAKIAANKILVTLPGNLPGTSFPLSPDSHFAAKKASFEVPKINLPITAGAAGTTITAKLVHLSSDSIADPFHTNGANNIPAHAECDPDANTLGSVQVVTPPPPGAPNAVADTASTKKGTQVTIDVLKNDVPDAQLPLDANSVAVTKAPGHGNAEVNPDHTITYVPAAGFTGTDTFTYKVCSTGSPESTTTTSEQVQITSVVQPCDTAIVTIEVAASETSSGGSTTTTVHSTGTTVAAAASELPRTGGSSLPLALFGVTTIALGLAGIALRRGRIS